ncbi:phosphoglycerol transferase MdoB-like AlkP superfamily enzyme [Maribacter spongiicola]|uniref:Phosphoglycerol transferase MdoB-like AlkP superfamily enzyme n=1 Tax=Maribacter spongiicola TaxID=1206753 RepID=A0A4R7K4Z2_9FLAO|nr:LTA synthase family protein [Maribacter spongiicola]TDT46256.1 phosphoglycerol transferase MdoB-like AlkP superfamily enzyme [Maribacter spongiicola]
MLTYLFPKRFSLLKAFVLLFISLSFLVRLTFFIWGFSEVDAHLGAIIKTFITGLFYDVGTLSIFMMPFLLYLFIFPKKWYGSLVDRAITWFGFFIAILIIYFSFFGEFTFWDEFQRRFNFIAVDYLIYTYEVVKNINESYPLPLLLGTLISLVALTLFISFKRKVFHATFKNETTFKQRAFATLPWVAICVFFSFFITNAQAEWSKNRYNNEISKAGIYSFFAAFRNNELAFSEFYSTMPETEAFANVKNQYLPFKVEFTHPNKNEIYRTVHTLDTTIVALKPNVIFICIESLSGKYLNSLGNDENITPVLDSLANHSLFFNNLYATGTRTVRGMEAITLSIPPTPGRSIVKRSNNTGLFTIGEVFKNQGYDRNFFYGGDGYFDNMNTFFGGNGFNIIDRGRGFLLDEAITVKRTNIEDDEVTFENAWGVCDEDIYNKVLKEADIAHESGKPFFDFVMTTSNHKPFTYPEGKIDIPSGTGRNGAVKYTDFAIGAFLKEAQKKPWFANTVFVIMSDHCASSAGKWELDVANYHIPAFIYNLQNKPPAKINTLCSQIDVFPTLFSTLGWNYESNLFGMDILKMRPQDERAFIGNYRKLGYLKDNKVMVLGDGETVNFYDWNALDNSLKNTTMDESFKKLAISNYQVADELYHNGGLQLKSLKE